MTYARLMECSYRLDFDVTAMLNKEFDDWRNDAD